MLAYSTISQMGFMLLGLASGVVNGNTLSAANAYSSALFYVINDLSRGRSTRSGGARIIHAGPALPMAHAPGGTFSESGPRIIELTAR